jgi:hypothetical protein
MTSHEPRVYQLDMSWKERYDRMKRHYKWTDSNIAQITGNGAKSVTTVVNAKNQAFPRWLKLAIVIFEQEHVE